MAQADHGSQDHELELLRQGLDAEERRCVELQSQLDRANEDFAEFISMAAHNLRESLREVAAYSQLLAETGGGRPDSDPCDSLAHIQEGSARMQSVLADMVDYWAMDSIERQPSRLEMEAVLSQALLLTDRQIIKQSATVTHDPLPAVMGDFGILTKVLHHLVRNAIEYCDAPAPRVHISSRRQDLDWVFSVSDNGPGIDQAFQGRLFRPFKRLHGREHPGNGLGLAFCKKAVGWHGGRVWMESSHGAGSTFLFTLPPAD